MQRSSAQILFYFYNLYLLLNSNWVLSLVGSEFWHQRELQMTFLGTSHETPRFSEHYAPGSWGVAAMTCVLHNQMWASSRCTISGTRTRNSVENKLRKGPFCPSCFVLSQASFWDFTLKRGNFLLVESEPDTVTSMTFFTDTLKSKSQIPTYRKTPLKAIYLQVFGYCNNSYVNFSEHFCLIGLRSNLLKYVWTN